ncbi:MAG: NifU family protein [Myxococcota bacterium]
MSDDLESLVRDLERLDEVVSTWDANQQLAVGALRRTIEAIQKEAFRRIVAEVKQDPAGLAALRRAVDDPWVFNVLSYHGLLKKPEPPIEERIERALDTVRPSLAGHGGDVRVVAFVPPDEVRIRMVGSCDGCAFTDVTVKLGVEKALLEGVPELKRVTVVKGTAPADAPSPSGSPFAVPWEDAGAVDDVPEGGVVAVELAKASVLLTRIAGEVKVYPNACAHLGMPLEMGEVRDGVITCSYHGFEFRLDTGECLTAPEIALPSLPVRVDQGRVQIRVVA